MQVVVTFDVARERLLATHALRDVPRGYRRVVDAAHPGPQPRGFALSDHPRQRRGVVRKHVFNSPEPGAIEPLAELRTDARDVGQIEALEEPTLAAIGDDEYARGR